MRNLSIKLSPIYICYTNITLYQGIHSVRYYPRFHVTAVGRGTYHLRLWGSTCIQKDAGIEPCRIMNIPPTKAGISQNRDSAFRLHDTIQNLSLFEGFASVFIQANKSNQTNFRMKAPRPKFRCSLLERFNL